MIDNIFLNTECKILTTYSDLVSQKIHHTISTFVKFKKIRKTHEIKPITSISQVKWWAVSSPFFIYEVLFMCINNWKRIIPRPCLFVDGLRYISINVYFGNKCESIDFIFTWHCYWIPLISVYFIVCKFMITFQVCEICRLLIFPICRFFLWHLCSWWCRFLQLTTCLGFSNQV